METFHNCIKTELHDGIVICEKCGARYKLEYDSVKSPNREFGIINCKDCDVLLLKWNSTREPYLIMID